MKSTYLTPLLAVIFLGCGFLAGQMVKGKTPAAAKSKSLQAAKSNITPKSARRSNSSFQFLNEASDNLRSAPDLPQEVTRLYRELKSPLRATSLLKYQVEENSFEEWALLLGDKQVRGKHLLSDVARRLVLEDVDRVLEGYLAREYRTGNLDEGYAFRNSLFKTVARTSPEKGLAAIQSMTRGGAQMDNGRFFSMEWAKADPEGAAQHFEELVTVRNMSMDGQTALPRDRYANDLMKEWVKKDREGANEYLENLPSSPTKTTLEKAFTAATD